MQRQNVLMITVDQLGRNHMELGGDPNAEMPTLRYAAAQGVQFDNCYSTCPVCIPARRSLMTGLYPRTHGDRVYSDRMPMPPVATLAQTFRDGGYQTFAVGKLHVYPQRSRIGFDDVLLMEEGRYEFGEVDDYQLWLGDHGFVGQEYAHGMGNNTYYARSWHLPEYAHQTNWIAREMCRAIRRRDPTRPGFFYASFPGPHPPLVPPAEYLERYAHVELAPPRQGDWLGRAPVIGLMREDAGQYNERERELARRAYYACCTHIDHQIRLLLGALRENGMLDNTVVLFCSDHGDMLFDHGMVAKRSFYEGSANIPLFIAGKAISEKGLRGSVDHRLCSLEDVMPTLLELCGIPVPDTVEGRSLLGRETDRPSLFGEISEGAKATRMLRTGRFKLIYYPNGNCRQLFDMENDRAELHDLAEDPAYSDILEKMTAELVLCLHGAEDEGWVRDGRLAGTAWTPPPPRDDLGLNNQRGFHWPVP